MAAAKRISETQYRAACTVASRVHAQKMKSADGVALLASDFGVNETSALDFIRDYRNLMAGKVLKRSMSAAAMSHFIEQISVEHGRQGLSQALTSLRAHIEYRPSRLMRKVLERFEALAAEPIALDQIEQAFAADVERSLRDTQTARLQRLSSASTMAKVVTVQTRIFVRNPDVVAAALVRAAGVCEGCHEKAPFLRAKDHAPYLEVHHKLHLANDGKDSLDNAIALCPNCHREAHYGASRAPQFQGETRRRGASRKLEAVEKSPPATVEERDD